MNANDICFLFYFPTLVSDAMAAYSNAYTLSVQKANTTDPAL